MKNYSKIRKPSGKIMGLFLMICVTAFTAGGLWAQTTAQLSGFVRTQDGEPLPGVTVQLNETGKDAKLGSMTDETGKFVINNLKSGTRYDIHFSYIGFERQELNAYLINSGENKMQDITMSESVAALKELVVVGYGNTTKNELTGSISSISTEEFNRGAFSSPSQMLQGKVPGLNITKSGDPNSRGTVILRGPSTLREGAQEPFYVIDGVPGASIDLVAPDDVISIDILKDASSTAIYGSRAANGVIMITTRKAQEGQSRVSYSGYVATEKISNTIDMLSGDQLRSYLEANGKSLNPSDDDGSNTNWMNEVSRNGVSHNHNLSLMGSSKNTSYGASVNYLKNNGVLKGSSMERYIVRANIQQKALNDRLKLNLSLTNSNTNSNNIPAEVYPNMLKYLPTVAVKRPDGSYTEDFSRTRGYLNPVSLIDNNILKTKTRTVLVNGLVQANILPGLDYTVSVALQDEQVGNDLYYNRQSGLALNTNGRAVRNSINNSKKVLETYFNYDKTFGKNAFKFLLGYSWQEDRLGDGFQTSNQGFVTDDLTYYNPGLGDPPAGVVVDYGNIRIQTQRLISFYGRVNYTFNDKFLFQASLRRDGSSAFGNNNQWGYFPSVSGGWRISKENFLVSSTFIDDLKLRVGYGVSGNSQGFDAFTSTLLYGTAGRFYYNGKFINAIGPFQNENPNLRWERTAMVNAGLDFTFLRGLITGSLDFYDKRTTDLIWTYPVSTTQYFVNTLTANAGEVSNKGVELDLSIRLINSGKFSWKTGVNLAHNKNELVSLSNDNFDLPLIYTAYLGGKGQSGNTSQVVEKGQPIGTFYTWRYAGKNENGITQIYSKDGTPTISPSSNDFTYTGSAQPKLLYGWNNQFKYGAFDFNFFVRGVTGNKILNATLADLNSPNDATNTNIPVFTLNESTQDNNAYLLSDRFIENGSYLRLDNATLGYTIKTAAKNPFRLYVTTNNLFVLTKYRGIDPEINIGGLTPGIDNANFYPKTRSFIVGLNITF